MPQPDPEVERVSAERARIRARVFLPDTQTVSTCLDKFAALSQWHRAGLRKAPVPISHNDPSNIRKIRRSHFQNFNDAVQEESQDDERSFQVSYSSIPDSVADWDKNLSIVFLTSCEASRSAEISLDGNPPAEPCSS